MRSMFSVHVHIGLEITSFFFQTIAPITWFQTRDFLYNKYQEQLNSLRGATQDISIPKTSIKYSLEMKQFYQIEK